MFNKKMVVFVLVVLCVAVMGCSRYETYTTYLQDDSIGVTVQEKGTIVDNVCINGFEVEFRQIEDDVYFKEVGCKGYRVDVTIKK